VVRAIGSPPHPDVFTFVVQTSATLRAALHAAVEHLPLRANSFRLELVEGGGECALVQRRAPSPRLGRRLGLEATLVEILGMARRFLPALTPARVELEHGPSHGSDAYRAHCRCPVVFNASRSALVFTEDQMALPLPNADPALAAYFDARCREALAALAKRGDVVEAVREHVLRALPERPLIGRAAASVGVSERTLRRQLADRDTTFEAVVATTRIALADQHLQRTDLTSSEIAYLVGFSDVSSFARLYKRETGHTPKRRAPAP
jgi:AraC-like DNA-binding protein